MSNEDSIKEQLERDPLGSITLPNGIRIGFVDEVNGPSSEQVRVPISRHEARLLARHWMERYERCDYRIHFGEMRDGTDGRVIAYAGRRIGELRDAGLVSQDEVDAIAKKAYAKHADEWEEALDDAYVDEKATRALNDWAAEGLPPGDAQP